MTDQQTAVAAPDPSEGRARVTPGVILGAITQGSPAVITILAIFAALVVGGLLVAVTDPVVLRAWDSFGYAPGTALSATWTSVSAAYSALFEGSIFSPATVAAAFHGGSIAAIFYPLSKTVFKATPLILTGLSVGVAFRAGLFNIGASGQLIGGAIVAAWLGADVSLPPVIHVIVCVVGAAVGGTVIGWLIGELKARTGAHEVIVTIMLNYVMIYLLQYVLSSSALLQGPQNNIAPLIARDAALPHVGGPAPQASAGFLIAIAAAAGVAWLLTRSTIGFQIRTVGANPSAARSAGMKVERTWVLVMLIAGALAGLAASAVLMSGDSPPPALSNSTAGSYGFDGITVALLGRARPGGIVLAGLLFGALSAGATNLAGTTTVPVDIVQALEGLIVLFVAAPPLIRAIFRLRQPTGADLEGAGKGWNG